METKIITPSAYAKITIHFGSLHIGPKSPHLDHHVSPTIHSKVSHFLHSEKVHHILNILLILDIVLLVTSMQLELHYLDSKLEDFKHECMESTCPTSSRDFHHFGNHEIELAEETCAYISVGILSLFALEHIILIICDGFHNYFRFPFQVLDLFVVLVSLGFETLAKKDVAMGTGVLIIARSWRFMRVVHGVVEIDHSEGHAGGGEHGGDDKHGDDKTTFRSKISL